MIDFKKVYKKRNFWILLGVILLAALLTLTLLLIYTKDQPKVIPEEVREDIRGTIKENIAKPAEKVLPIIGKPMVKAAYESSKADVENWLVFIDDRVGYEIKYPKEYVVFNFDKTTYIGASNNINKVSNQGKLLVEDVISITRLDEPNLVNYIESSFDGTDVDKIEETLNGYLVYFVKDEGANRFGGGTGYYYYVQTKNGIIELALDYFGEKEDQNENIEILKKMFKSLKI